MKDTYFDQNLPDELLCEICKEVCNEPLINAETGLIYCFHCSSLNGLIIKGLDSQALRSIYYKCQQCFRYKKYFKFRVHLKKCLKYYQNQQKGKERFNLIGQTQEVTQTIYLLVELELNKKFDDEKQLEYINDTNYKIFCNIEYCQKELHVSQVKNHFKNCQYQQKSCNHCEHWQGTKVDQFMQKQLYYQKQMCYLELKNSNDQINELEFQINQSKVKKRILEKSLIKFQNKLFLLEQRQIEIQNS